MVVPISEKSAAYCNSVYLYLHQKGWQVDIDNKGDTLPKKVKKHTMDEWNFIVIAGEEEAREGTVDIKTREHKRLGKMRVDELHHYFTSLLPQHSTQYQKFYQEAWNPANFSAACCDHTEPENLGAPKAAKAP